METLITIALLAANAALSGFIFSQMWLWFVVPLGAAAIGVAHAYGLLCLIGLPFVSHGIVAGEKTKMPGWLLAICIMVGELVSWGLAAIAHSYMG